MITTQCRKPKTRRKSKPSQPREPQWLGEWLYRHRPQYQDEGRNALTKIRDASHDLREALELLYENEQKSYCCGHGGFGFYGTRRAGFATESALAIHGEQS